MNVGGQQGRPRPGVPILQGVTFHQWWCCAVAGCDSHGSPTGVWECHSKCNCKAEEPETMTETTTPEPDWRAQLFHELTDASDGQGRLNRGDARDIATGYIEPLVKRVADLEEGGRALGGDSEHVVDPRDHEAALEALRKDMTNAALGGLINIEQARKIAKEHMLRMAQSAPAPSVPPSLVEKRGAVFSVLREKAAEEVQRGNLFVTVNAADLLGLHATMEEYRETALSGPKRDHPAPSVREVPASEAREGDTFTITGTVERFGVPTGLGLSVNGLALRSLESLEGSPILAGTMFSRPVSPLPTEPGVFGSARRKFGSDPTRFNLMTMERDGVLYFVAEYGSEYGPDEIADFLPAGAGVGEGGKR